MRFHNREEAGQQLAEKLAKYKREKAVILALPRGGVVLGVEIAKALEAPLDLVIPRKIGHPHNPEYAIAAVTESGKLVANETEIAAFDPEWFERAVQKEISEAKRRRQTYLQGKNPALLKGKTAIIVDDGVATGLTMRAAIKDVRARDPERIVVAIPVTPKDTAGILQREADELVVLDIPAMYLGAVGAYYQEFTQVEDGEVIKILEVSSKT